MKKMVRDVIYIYIILLFVFGCMNIKTHKADNDTNYFNKHADNRYKIGIDNFVFLTKKHKLEIGCSEDTGDPICDPVISSVASGMVFSSDSKSLFVLTAAHFCKKENYPGLSEEIIGTAKDQDRVLSIISINEKSDICLLIGVKYKDETFNQVVLQISEPELGSDVYTVAGPNGFGGPGLRPVFVGKFAGCDKQYCMSTIPATFGSSGAGIYTEDGKLITIVMAVPKDFNNLVISPSQVDIHKFIRNIDDLVDIYTY